MLIFIEKKRENKLKMEKHWEQSKLKITKAEQEWTTNNKTDQWRSKECGNKDVDPNISYIPKGKNK